MNRLSIDTIAQELKSLPLEAREEVYDFIEFLKSRQKSDREKMIDKKKLLKISVWEKNDIELILNAQKDINTWNIEKY